MVKPENCDHLHLNYHFTVPLNLMNLLYIDLHALSYFKDSPFSSMRDVIFERHSLPK